MLPGKNKKVRRELLHTLIVAWYAKNGVKDRIVGLRSWGVQAPKSSPKLKANAACVRALIPFAHEASLDYLVQAKPTHAAMTHASKALLDCYNCLSSDSLNWRAELPRASKDFAIQFAALQAASTNKRDWKIKPKMHQFLEMCQGNSKPNMSWCYRDEDFGGSIAQLCRIKGGCWRNVSAYAGKMLLLFRTLNDVPRVRKPKIQK